MWPFTSQKSDGPPQASPQLVELFEKSQSGGSGSSPAVADAEQQGLGGFIPRMAVLPADQGAEVIRRREERRRKADQRREKSHLICGAWGATAWGGSGLLLLAGLSMVDVARGRYRARQAPVWIASAAVPLSLTAFVGHAAMTEALYSLKPLESGNVERALWYFSSTAFGTLALPAILFHGVKYYWRRPATYKSAAEYMTKSSVPYPLLRPGQVFGCWKPIQAVFAAEFALVVTFACLIYPLAVFLYSVLRGPSDEFFLESRPLCNACVPPHLVRHMERRRQERIRSLYGAGPEEPSDS
eukprot:TRINITY_DN16166_c0_g1_i1.p1 TRINITY_DN16166_c0_g1~~TRINITY_DN16166_c0_g1_i1.p1  ORF type:complete len:299 (+),score=66.21 TRINITY_DN16166_c0_g1_i1:67-963(+)